MAAVPTPTSIGTAVTSSANATTVTLTTNTAVSVGNTILVSYGLGDTRDLLTVTDSAGNTYTIDKQDKRLAPTIACAIVRTVATAALPSGGTITATHSGTAAALTKVIAAFKVTTTLTAEGTPTSASTNAVAAYATPTITTVGADRLLWGVAQNSAGVTSTPGAGITEIADVTSNATGYQKLPTPGSYAYTGTFSGASGAWVAIAAAYRTPNVRQRFLAVA